MDGCLLVCAIDFGNHAVQIQDTPFIIVFVFTGTGTQTLKTEAFVTGCF